MIYKTAINKPITTALIFVAVVILGIFHTRNCLSTNFLKWILRMLR